MNNYALGQTGLTVSQIGMGVLTVGRTQLDLSIDEGAQLIRYAIGRGINFLDTAEYYETYPYIAAADVRDVIISSKSLVRDKAGMTNAIEDCRMMLGRDQIDIFLLHEIRTQYDFFNRAGAWQALIDAKARGLVKAIGLSTHHIDGVEIATTLPDLDVVFPLINHRSLGIRKGNDTGSKEEMAKSIKLASLAGKGIFTMKALGGGNLAGEYVSAMNYVTGLPGVSSVILGMGSKRDIDNAIDYAEGKLSVDFHPDISKKKMYVEQGNCEGCGACINICTSKAIDYNSAACAEINTDICVKCGYCAYACPVRAIILLDIA